MTALAPRVPEVMHQIRVTARERAFACVRDTIRPQRRVGVRYSGSILDENALVVRNRWYAQKQGVCGQRYIIASLPSIRPKGLPRKWPQAFSSCSFARGVVREIRQAADPPTCVPVVGWALLVWDAGVEK